MNLISIRAATRVAYDCMTCVQWCTSITVKYLIHWLRPSFDESRFDGTFQQIRLSITRAGLTKLHCDETDTEVKLLRDSWKLANGVHNRLLSRFSAFF